MYFTLTKPTFTRWRSTPPASLSKLLKSLKKRHGKIVVLSKRHTIRHPPPEVDPTTQACYDYLRSSSSSSSNHVRRDHDFLRRYGCLVDQGEWLLEEGLVNAAGTFADPPRDFGLSPFNRNGWSVVDTQEPLPLDWDEVFQGRLSGITAEDEFPYVRLDQNRSFDNDYHFHVDRTYANYDGFYLPRQSFILMTRTYSPTYRVSIRGSLPSDQIIERIPRLNSLSDAIWPVWTRISNHPGSLRYYAVNDIVNDITGPLMDYLLDRDRPEHSAGMTFAQGVTYGLDSDEGKALLASPSGIAVFWLLVHRRGILGGRDPRVTIWEGEDGNSRRMIWELIPAGEESTFDDYRAANFTQSG
ncbi:MAG: hypothetical protein Q9215_004987 [Flavoplaca cf. flavocitrina]